MIETFGGANNLTADIRLQLGDGGIALTLEDDGQPFDPNVAEAPDVDAALEDRQIGRIRRQPGSKC